MSTEKSSPEAPRVHHVYDGIVEQDNRLPNWWLGLLFGTIAFAFVYWVYYEVVEAAPGPYAEYRASVAAREAELAKRPKATLDDELLATLAANEATVAQGKQVFAQNCAACHGQSGQGLIGPNLTDGFFLHGGKPTAIFKVVHDGSTQKGMPAWGPALGEERVKIVAAYVLSLKGQNVEGGKAPQGQPE